MKNSTKKANNVSVGQVMGQFWKGMGSMKSFFFASWALFFVAQVINIIIPIYYKKFFDIIGKSINPTATAPLLVEIIIFILILHLVNQIFWNTATFLFTKMQATVMARLKQNSFNYMIEHSYTFFANNFGGSLIQRVGRFTRAFEVVTDSLVFVAMPLIITVAGSIWVTWSIAHVFSLIIIGGLFVAEIFTSFIQRYFLSMKCGFKVS